MRYIESLKDGDRLEGIYFVKSKRTFLKKNNVDEYFSVQLMDKTGVLECKIWDIYSPGIKEFEEKEYINVNMDISTYQGALQGKINNAYVADPGSYDETDYMPVSKNDIDGMYEELVELINSVNQPHMKQLLEMFFVDNKSFIEEFKKKSAAKTVHHAFIGGLLEHTLSVAKLSDSIAKQYDYLDRDLLVTAAIFHDVGKVAEFSDFPDNDYTDAGQMLGHIVMGYNVLSSSIAKIEGFPTAKKNELLHCILAHHGKLEYGSPKTPAIAEAFALNFADDMDAKLETMKEMLEGVETNDLSWQGFKRTLDTNIRKTSEVE